ncbi:FAST kinase domain-containing protein 5, mitochondrial [Denticeps clupeoides]|uniref:RAP domain-containing protein n=1 Tax=Denticeps clupeoides TaxID=299321 RepID=A0AAY4BHF0_9TELE|nr:FAST kinase domain-containing protein 5, mitochondrial [Denticeps clupeoides]
MSVRALGARAARLHRCVCFSRGSHVFRSHCSREEQEEPVESETEAPPCLSGAGDYALLYNPSAYRQPAAETSAPLGRSGDGATRPALLHPGRQQGNPYTVSSSRRLSISKNTLLDLAFSRDPGSKGEMATPAPADVQGEPRAFQTCRSEYRSFTHDLSPPPPPLESKEASLILHTVTAVRGKLEPRDVAHFLSELGRLPPGQSAAVRADSRFNMLLRYSVESLARFTHGQLLEALRALVCLDLPPAHGVLGLYEAEFSRRAPELQLHQLLLAADRWRRLGRSVPRYLESLYGCVGPRLGDMGPAELVLLIYIMGEGRRSPASLLRPLEHALLRTVERLEPEEVGAVCLGLFKSQSALSTGTVQRLADRACELVRDMSDFAIVGVMKLLRFSHLDHLPWLKAMGREVPRRAPGMGAQGLMHVALACSALHYRDDAILMAVAENLPDRAPHCRSKDACKLLWAFGNLRVRPARCPDLYSCLTDVLRRRGPEFQRYPEHLLTGLLGLAFVGLFPRDLINAALSAEFVARACSYPRLELKTDLYALDGTVGLEVPGWTGPRLGRALKEQVARQVWDYAQEDVCKKPEVLAAEAALQQLLGGARYVRKHMILPHTRSVDLEVHLDPNGRPLPVLPEQPPGSARSEDFSWDGSNVGVTLTDDLLAQLTGTPKTHPDPPEVGALEEEEEAGRGLEPNAKAPVRLAVQVTHRNQYCYRSQRLLGLHALKRRQLVRSGYRVVELAHWEWFPLLRRSQAEKTAYLHGKIFSREHED